jgi:localization factor PodJL
MKKYIIALCFGLFVFSTAAQAAIKSAIVPAQTVSSTDTNCADRFALRPAEAQEQLKSANAAVGSGQFDQARKIYERLASAGFSGAMKNLSIMYSEGLGVRKDVARAEYWQKEAEQAAMIDAVCMNGIHSQEGK